MKKKELNFEIVIAECSQCSHIKKLSFFKGETTRYTFCINCNKPVIWNKIK